MDEAPLGLLFAILAALIILSGFFSGSETGMMSLNRFRLRHMANAGNRGAQRASAMLERTDRLIGLILIGNNLVNIAASALATVIAIRLYGDAGVVIATLLLTLVILIFAEITPKTIAALHPEKVAFPASVALLPLMRVLYPAIFLINVITNSLLRLLGFDPGRDRAEHVSKEELRTIVTHAGDLIPEQHRGMLVNILDLEAVTVNDIMVPRNDVYGIDLDDSDETIVQRMRESAHTLIPVWQGDINNIEGVLHLRDTSRVLTAEGIDRAALKQEMDKPYFVPENTPLHTQLLNFQQKKLRLGVVVDEYGDVMGLVALADILEEIVGEFTSNLTDTSDEIFPQRDGSYIISGAISVRELNRSLGWNLPTRGPKTLSGLILETLEAFPDGNCSIVIASYAMEILELEGNVIRSVRIASRSR